MKCKFKIGRRFTFLTAGLCLIFLISLVFSSTSSFSANNKTYETLKLFTEVLDLIEKNYVEEIDTDEIIHEAIHGMITALDPHSAYWSPEVYHEMEVDTKGVFGGLGVVITMKDDFITVISPIEDKPAYEAGIEAGDRIVKINGDSTKGMTLMDAVQILRGPAGTKVTITIAREAFDTPKDFEITRAIIKIQSVKYKKYNDDIAYIRITQFQETTVDELRKVLKEITQDGPTPRGLVLDLRNNPGGLLDQSILVSDVFLKDGTIVSTKGRSPESEKVYRAHDDGDEPEFPMIVLINGGSASASEIVSGALQDSGRAILLGTQTFGKASMQIVVPLDDGSALKLTTARYYTPNGRSIQATGIQPDIRVEYRTPDNNAEKKTPMLREKDLSGHLEGIGESAADEKEGESSAENKHTELLKDNQLKHAVDLLKSWDLFKKMQQC